MNTLLWGSQLLLASVFLMTGSMKLFFSRKQLIERMGDWPEAFSAGFLKFIGGAEVLGAIGVVVPWLTKIAPVLSPLAAAGLAIIMVGATWTHVKRGEIPNVMMGVAIFALAVFVSWGRFG